MAVSSQSCENGLNHNAKIICTIGPACETEDALERLVLAGMDVARLNFSHGSHETHALVVERLRKVAKKLDRHIAILQDLQGPKIRISRFVDGRVEIVTGATFTITTREVEGGQDIVSSPYKQLPNDVKEGGFILLRDGLIKLQVKRVDDQDVICTVIDGGMLPDRSGVSLPGVRISEPCLTEKDREDLDFGLTLGVDYVALSFVRDPEDLVEIKQLVKKKSIPIIAKLETAESLGKLDAIIDAADAVMVARGDLGVEISSARVPVVQKDIIERCHHKGVPVITATQMLDSMASQPTPTRAEASDVANAVYDGSDAVMLSVETAFGKYPTESVETMAAIINEAEKSDYFRLGEPNMRADRLMSAQSICRAAYHTAEAVNAKLIVACTTTGITARLLCKYRPAAPLVAFSRFPNTLRRMALYWGVRPIHMEYSQDVEEAICNIVDQQDVITALNSGDKVVITSGSSLTAGGTNLMRLYTHK